MDEPLDDENMTLEEQLAATRARAEAAEARASSAESRFDAFLQGSRFTQTPPAEPRRAAPLGPMPDPSVDWDGHQRWQAEKDRRQQEELDRRLEAQRNEITEQVTTQQRASMMWSRFQTKYPEHAKRSSLVTAAYQQLVQAGTLPDDIETGVDAVRAEMDRMVGAPIDKLKPEPNRTEDLGQAPRQVRRRAAAAPEDEAPPTMHDSIMKQKVKYGLI